MASPAPFAFQGFPGGLASSTLRLARGAGTGGGGQPSEWVTLAEASQRLGATVDALRKRVRRGQLEARRGNDGLVYCLVAGQLPSGQGLANGQPEAGHKPDGTDVETALLREELTEAR